MKKIGLLVAVEINSVLKSGFTCLRKENVGKFDVYIYEISGNQIIVIKSGAGQTMAAAASEILISIYKVEYIINFGIVGSLREDISLGNTCVIENIVDYSFDTSEIDQTEVGRHIEYPSIYLKTDQTLLNKALSIAPDLKKVNCASGNKFVSTSKEKQELHSKFNCDIVEMEAAAILLVANMHNIPALFIKGISDSLNGGAIEFVIMFHKASDDCYSIITKLLENNF